MVVRVYPGAKNPTHEISLSDGVQTWGLRLDGGPKAILERPLTPSTVLSIGQSGKFGDYEPGLSHIEQRTWVGGRGLEDFVDDPTRFYDSMNAWTLTPGRLLPAPQSHFAQGIRESYQHLPGNVDWQALLSEKRYLSSNFTVGAANFAAQNAYLWLRRVGSPGTLTAEIWTDTAEDPNTAVANRQGLVTINTLPDIVSQWVGVDISTAADLTASTTYHLVIYADANDNAANHWEVGVDKSGASSKYSTAGSSWMNAEFTLYHRLLTADTERKWHFFIYKDALYAADQRADGVKSSLFMNGDRGKATANTSTTLSDSTKIWTVDDYAEAWVKIIGGTGKGQVREITSNTATQLTLTTAWDQTPDTTSLYIIYATPLWQDISPTTGDQIDGVVQDAVVLNDQVLFAQGQSVNILKMRWNDGASPPAHEFDDDGTNKADRLKVMTDATNGLRLWRADNTNMTVSMAAPAAWLTNMSYGSTISVGDDNAPITSLYDNQGRLFVFKTDGRYYVDPSLKASRSVGDVGFVRSDNNAQTVLPKGIHTYFSWGGFGLHRFIDLSGNEEFESIGPDQDAGLPQDRRGAVAALAGYPGGIIAGIDAGKNTSSVLAWNKVGWHEIFRAWEAGQRVQNLFWQDCPGARPRLWISVGGELVYQDWPNGTSNPIQDTGFKFQHESVLVTASIDMGAARLPKFIKELSLASQNLTTGVEVHLEVQTDADIGTDTWIRAETFYSSPEDTLPIHQGDVRRVRLRLRLLTNQADTPPVIHATVLEGFARTPVKYQWGLQVKLGDTQRDLSGVNTDHDPDAFLTWLKDAARQARRIRMRSVWEQLDGKLVLVEPPNLSRQFTNNILGFWGGKINVTIREA